MCLNRDGVFLCMCWVSLLMLVFVGFKIIVRLGRCWVGMFLLFSIDLLEMILVLVMLEIVVNWGVSFLVWWWRFFLDVESIVRSGMVCLVFWGLWYSLSVVFSVVSVILLICIVFISGYLRIWLMYVFLLMMILYCGLFMSLLLLNNVMLELVEMFDFIIGLFWSL